MSQVQLLRSKIEAILTPLGLSLEEIAIKPEEGEDIVLVRIKVEGGSLKSLDEKQLDIDFNSIIERLKS